MRNTLVVISGALVSFVVLWLGASLVVRGVANADPFVSLQKLDTFARFGLFPFSVACSAAFAGGLAKSNLKKVTILSVAPVILFFAASQLFGMRFVSVLPFSLGYAGIALAVAHLSARWRGRGAQKLHPS